MKNKIITMERAARMISDGSSVFFSGFLGVGCAQSLIYQLNSTDVKDLTMIVIATDYEKKGVGPLIVSKKVKKVIASHIGTNPETQRQYNEGEIEVEFVPQGTLVEKIRCAALGIGGFLTPTGVGTRVEEGKEIVVSEEKKYILETPIKADFALIHARKADEFGNLWFNETAQNSNLVMGMAAETTIVEVEEMAPIGKFDPNTIHLPGIFVDYIVPLEKANLKELNHG